jgi:hypothetical protein
LSVSQPTLAGPNDLSLPLDFFGILVINVHDIIVGMAGGLEQLIELCVNGLDIPVFSSLDD